jgi:hypothetical protein
MCHGRSLTEIGLSDVFAKPDCDRARAENQAENPHFLIWPTGFEVTTIIACNLTLS